MNSNLLLYLEKNDLSAFQNWIREILTSDRGVEFRASLEKSLYNSGLVWSDVRYALTNCVSISTEYGRGCYVVHGPTVDGEDICVVAAIRISDDRIKLIKVWKE